MVVADRARGLGEARALAVFRRPVLAHAVHADRAPQRCEPLGECPAEAASGPGDQGDLVLQRTGLCHGLLIELSRRSRLSLPWRGLAGKPGNPLASQSLPCRVRQPMIAPWPRANENDGELPRPGIDVRLS
jgi:hypothetical protein